MRRPLPLLPLLLVACAPAARSGLPAAAPPAPAPAASLAGAPGTERLDGFIPVLFDARRDRLSLELPHDSLEALLFVSEATGLGSNPVGLDRGANEGAYVARFVRRGDRVLVQLENTRYRTSDSLNAAHVRSVRESFPPSTVAALPAQEGVGGRLVVDATELLLRDWIGAERTLQATGQGSYVIAREMSGPVREHVRAFPDNTELDAALTYTSGAPGATVSATVPDGHAFTIRQHLSLVRLPVGYRPRVMDPRVGYFGIRFHDYAQPVQGALEQRWVARHRLERVNPADPSSPFRNPIVYYIDPGIPEPIRTATRQGVSFWVEAFDRAGLKGAFRVEELPAGADPMDIRYNVVQWENRNERGWSVGGAQTDPRTGEMLKGMARLDSHRARTSYNLYAGLMGADPSPADTHFVLGRVRQVSAHEVGHTLGLAHNYIASTYERASVMDYPAPRLLPTRDGGIDLSQAYATGPGDYDVWAIRWGYGIFPPGSEADSLEAIVAEGLRKGYLFLSDADARPPSGSDPRVNLWDDADAVTFLERQMAVRRTAIARFGLRNIREGEPVSLLQERFVPVYLGHRFALNAVSKAVGGVEYANAVRGDGQQATRSVPAAEQRRALALLIGALAPAELAIPDTVVTLLAPRPFDYEASVELFGSRTSPTFDELGAARTLAQLIVDGVLQRDRAARLVQQAAHDPAALTLGETIARLRAATWAGVGAAAGVAPAKAAALRRVTQRALADRLVLLAADTAAAPEARAAAGYALAQMRPEAERRAQAGTDADRAHWTAVAEELRRWMERREAPVPTRALTPPPGDPFGEDEP